ncbi:hypothetical protein [Longicatena caecimuris]|uniref:hypothetical protein n=1 Tax=Longicatena caecimuris TaxID=1796635 RepID=UPI0018A9AE3E|nr:hypothetical protein [Longicatena caecimuris]
MDNKKYKYESLYIGHSRNARKLISKFVSKGEMVLMTDDEVAKEVNARFTAILIGDDWVLIPNEKLEEVARIVKWIKR